MVDQVFSLGVFGPPLEADLEDRQPHLRDQARVGFDDAAPVQGGGHRRGQRGVLHHLALAKLLVGGDQAAAPPDLLEAPLLLDEPTRILHGGGDRVERRGSLGGGGDRVDDGLLQDLRAPEENLALVGVVPEEGPLGETRPRGDLLDRGPVVAPLAKELPGGLPQFLLPTTPTTFMT